MAVTPVSGASKALASYDRQRFFAERAAQIRLPRIFQVGVEDRVIISPEAAAKLASQEVAAKARQDVRAITYDDPRKRARGSVPAGAEPAGTTASGRTGAGGAGPAEPAAAA